MLFAKPGVYEPCGIFTKDHFILMFVTIIGIIGALKNTINKSKEDVKKIIKNCTIFMWILEFIMITFKIITGGIKNVNNYVPLYYCSLLLYAGLLSSFAKGKLQHIGDVFLATGGIIGGIVFMIFPSTSLPTYPAWHMVSLHSFLYHGTMVYLGLLINATNYIELEKQDIKYFASLVGTICVLAFIINQIFDSNLMFISQDFPNSLIHIIYKMTGPFYTIFMSLSQMILPFYIVYGFLQSRKENKRANCKEECYQKI